MNMQKLLIIIVVTAFVTGRSQSPVFDATFGVNGKALCNFNGLPSVVTHMALQPDGKIVACGRYYYNIQELSTNDGAICRFNADGTLDSGFGIGGKIILSGATYDELMTRGIKVLPDDKILILATSVNQTNPEFVLKTLLLKYNPDGTPDPDFGTGGVVHVALADTENIGNAMAVQDDGKIIIGGHVYGGLVNSNGAYYTFALGRLNVDGSTDTTFGSNGLATFDFPTGFDNLFSTSIVNDIQLQPDGKIVAAGFTKIQIPHNFDTQFAVVRTNIDGTPDTTFGLNGAAFTNFESLREEVQHIHILPDNKIIAVGTGIQSITQKIVVAKYNQDGSADTSYGTDGTVLYTNGSPSPRYQAPASVITADGKLLIGGFGDVPDATSHSAQAILLRLNGDGSADNTFAPNGTFFINDLVDISDMLFQPDGKLLVAATDLNNGYTASDFAVLRYEGTSLITSGFANASDLSVYPNPFGNEINIRFESSQNETVTAALFDMNGREVYHAFDRALSENHVMKMQLPSTLAAGVYLLKFSHREGSSYVRLIAR